MLSDVVWCDARGGSYETGRSASGATSSGVLTSVAVEVGGLQPSKRGSALHFTALEKMEKSFRVMRAGKWDHK